MLRPGGVILIDNTLWGGSVADPAAHDADTLAIRGLNLLLRDDDRIDLAHLPVGDGLALALKRRPLAVRTDTEDEPPRPPPADRRAGAGADAGAADGLVHGARGDLRRQPR